eukprot:11839563-Alexandrium_andersonii.AAC.1
MPLLGAPPGLRSNCWASARSGEPSGEAAESSIERQWSGRSSVSATMHQRFRTLAGPRWIVC